MLSKNNRYWNYDIRRFFVDVPEYTSPRLSFKISSWNEFYIPSVSIEFKVGRFTQT